MFVRNVYLAYSICASEVDLAITYFPGRLAKTNGAEWLIRWHDKKPCACQSEGLQVRQRIRSWRQTVLVYMAQHGAMKKHIKPKFQMIYIYMYFLKFHEKNANAQLVTRSLLLTRLNLSSCLARQSGESYWAMQVARVGLEACKGTRKAYRQHVVEIPVKISIYIYAVYCFCIQHSGQYVYSICLVYFQFANSRNLNDWGMNMEVGNSAFATVSHGCHFQTQMARKTLGSFCQLFSSDFGSDCCGNGSAESQVDKNKSSYKHSRADLIFQRNLRDPEGKLSLESVFVILCMFVPEGNAVTTIRILHDLVRVVAVEFCKCLMLDVGVIRRFMACPQARSREIPSIFPLALHWNSCISLLHEHAIDMRLIIVYLQI